MFTQVRILSNTQIWKKDNKKFGIIKYFLYLCIVKIKCGFSVTVSTTLIRGKEWFDSIGLLKRKHTASIKQAFDCKSKGREFESHPPHKTK